MHKIHNKDGEFFSKQKMLDIVSELRIFDVEKQPDGRFEIYECCDLYFSATVTKEQLIALGQELIDLANEEQTT